MDVYTAIETRRDSESCAPEPRPPREVIERLISAATWAPSHRRTEPWRFTVLAGDSRSSMGNAVADWMAATGAANEGQQAATRVRLLRAPVVIVVTQVGTPEDATRDREDYAACWCAIENLLLAAQAEGLAAHTSTGAMTEFAGAKLYLGLEEQDHIVAYIYLGYPPEGGVNKEGTRRPAVVRWEWE